MEIKPIGPEHAAEVAAIEEAMHDPKLIQGEARLRAFLQRASDSGNSNCFGLFRNGKMGGYLLCGDRVPTLFPQLKGDRVIYIYDISVLPKFRRLSFGLLTTWWEAVRQRFPDSAVEMHIIEEGKQLWLGHANMLTQNGLEFQLCEYDNREFKGQRRYRMRFNQVERYKTCTFDSQQHRQSLPIISEQDGLQLRVLDDAGAWPYYQTQLQALFDATDTPTPALDYWFQRSCWLHQGYGHRLHYYLLFDDAQLLAAAPLYQHQSKPLFGKARQQTHMLTPGFAPAILGQQHPLLRAQLPQTTAPSAASGVEDYRSAADTAPSAYECEHLSAGSALDYALTDLQLLHCSRRDDTPQLTALHDFMQQASFDADYCRNFKAEMLILRVHKQAFAAAYLIYNEQEAWIACSGRNIGNGYGNSQRLAARLAVQHLKNKRCNFLTRQ